MKILSQLFDGELELGVESLAEEKYMEIVEPLASNCKCYSCGNHTKNYICHLLNNHEMLGNVLLSIHNCFVYKEIFEV